MTTDMQHDPDATTPGGPHGAGRHLSQGDMSYTDERGRRPASAARLARTAGLLYLVVAIFGGFAQIVRVNVYEPGNAAATSANIVANANLVRLSFVADLVQALVWLVLAVTLPTAGSRGEEHRPCHGRLRGGLGRHHLPEHGEPVRRPARGDEPLLRHRARGRMGRTLWSCC